MAAPAIIEVLVAESAFAVVARHTALRALAGEMLRRSRRTDLPALRQSEAHNSVAALAAQALARPVCSVAKAHGIGARRRRSRRVRSELMTEAARGKTAGFAPR